MNRTNTLEALLTELETLALAFGGAARAASALGRGLPARPPRGHHRW